MSVMKRFYDIIYFSIIKWYKYFVSVYLNSDLSLYPSRKERDLVSAKKRFSDIIYFPIIKIEKKVI